MKANVKVAAMNIAYDETGTVVGYEITPDNYQEEDLMHERAMHWADVFSFNLEYVAGIRVEKTSIRFHMSALHGPHSTAHLFAVIKS